MESLVIPSFVLSFFRFVFGRSDVRALVRSCVGAFVRSFRAFVRFNNQHSTASVLHTLIIVRNCHMPRFYARSHQCHPRTQHPHTVAPAPSTLKGHRQLAAAVQGAPRGAPAGPSVARAEEGGGADHLDVWEVFDGFAQTLVQRRGIGYLVHVSRTAEAVVDGAVAPPSEQMGQAQQHCALQAPAVPHRCHLTAAPLCKRSPAIPQAPTHFLDHAISRIQHTPQHTAHSPARRTEAGAHGAQWSPAATRASCELREC